MGRAYTFGEKMNYLAEKLIGLVLCTVFGITALTGAPSASGAPSSSAPVTRDYIIQPTTTTSSTIYIDPYSTACEQFSALAINLGWDPNQRTVLESIMQRESNCTPNAINRKDPNGGSRGLLQINGSWHKWLIGKGIITKKQDLLQARTNLLAGLEIYNYGMERYGFGWGPWSVK
jgi:soluble lytic murein transglycosylase-like protein